jgi:phosphate transport system permease protein
MARVTTFGYLPIIAQAFADHVESLGIEHEVDLREMADMISEEAPAQLGRAFSPTPTSSGRRSISTFSPAVGSTATSRAA